MTLTVLMKKKPHDAAAVDLKNIMDIIHMCRDEMDRPGYIPTRFLKDMQKLWTPSPTTSDYNYRFWVQTTNYMKMQLPPPFALEEQYE